MYVLLLVHSLEPHMEAYALCSAGDVSAGITGSLMNCLTRRRRTAVI